MFAQAGHGNHGRARWSCSSSAGERTNSGSDGVAGPLLIDALHQMARDVTAVIYGRGGQIRPLRLRGFTSRPGMPPSSSRSANSRPKPKAQDIALVASTQ
jgi:hypothetical protein